MAMPDPTIVFNVNVPVPASEAFGAAYTTHEVRMMNVDSGQTDPATGQSYGNTLDPHYTKEAQHLAYLPLGCGGLKKGGQTGQPMGSLYVKDTSTAATGQQITLYGTEAIYARDMYCLPNDSRGVSFSGKATADRAWLKVYSINGATS